MTDPTEAIREAHKQVVRTIESIKEDGWGAHIPTDLYRAARNLKYALDVTAEVKADPLRQVLVRASNILKGAAEGHSVQIAAGQLLPDIHAALAARTAGEDR